MALTSGALAGFDGSYGYGVVAPYGVHAAPAYTKPYSTPQLVASAVTIATHRAGVTHVTKQHSYRTQHPVATPVARYSSYTAPAVHAVHTVPAVSKVAHVPAYGYGLGHGHGYGLGHAHDLSSYGPGYGYGSGYTALFKH